MKKTYVLNKPALLTSSEALSRFEDNDIVIPMAVLEDLKASLKSEKSARRAIGKKLLKYLSEELDSKKLMNEGIVLENGTLLKVTTNYTEEKVKVDNVSHKDMRILQTCQGLIKDGKNVVLISNDDTLRMKARNIGIVAEELKDRVFPPIKDQYKGYATVYCSDSDIDKIFSKKYLDVSSIYKHNSVEWLTNLYLNIKGCNSSAIGYFDGEKIVPICNERYPYDIKPKNVKQKFVLHALMDIETPIVIIKGDAGTGKTYCSLGAGLDQTMEKRIYEQILITRSITNGNGEEYGYLPGEIENKFDPYIYGIYDNLERLYNPSKSKYDDDKKSNGIGFESYSEIRNAIRRDLFETGIIEIQPLGFIRGRSIAKRWFIIDEMQNVDPEFAKSIVSRAGEGSKFIFLGDPTQIDAPDLSENYNGLVYLSEMMKGQKLCRQITLGGENGTVRSPLAQLAVDILV